MYKILSLLSVIFLFACSSTQELIKQTPVIAAPSLPEEKAIATIESNDIQIDIFHCYGNTEKREITIEYKIKNWGSQQSYVINAKGNSIDFNGKTYTRNCTFLNGEEQCGEHFSIKLNAKTDISWKGSYVFKNINDFESDVIDKLVLRYSDNQIKGNDYFVTASNIPITWDDNYLVNEAKKIPSRTVDDNNGLIMQIEQATLDNTTRELTVGFRVKNLSGKKRSFYINARDNMLILNNGIHKQSCAGIEADIKCDIHWTSGKLIDSKEVVSGSYIFKNVKNSDQLIIDKLELRYSESILNSKPYYAVFSKIQVE